MASCVCGSGIVKTHQLGFQECDSLRAVFAKDLSPNHIKLQSRILGEVVGNFPNFLEEVTLLADPECVRLKNYCKEDSVDQRATMTEVCLVPAEFDDYQIGVDAAITFCLKELRAVLLFTDALPQTVSLYFESAGSPVVFSIDATTEVKADFVLATLQDVADPTNPITNGTTAHSDSSTNAAGVRGKNAAHRQREQTRQNTRGRRRGTANGPGLTRRQDRGRGSVEDEWSHPFSSSNSRSTKEDRERTSEERLASVESVHRSSEAYHSTPSRQRMADARSRSSRTSEEHCTLGDAVMVEEDGHVTGDGAGGEGVTMVEEGEADPLDALFGEENMMDVGEGGWEGGRGGDFAAEGRPRSSSSEPQHKLPGFGISRSPHVVSSHLTSSCVRPSPKSPQTHTSHPHTPPSPTLPRREGEEEWRRGEEGGVSLTQDSILQDSGFLPGTPPAKKVSHETRHTLFYI
ncbi:Cell cycle checkpoint control protein RAD9B [Geodia barretti]|uniref:Cell cycle checkpoint control protein RAD9B n=1 Tax=Geodia barretti TaxID=519541 RepID=A0AA35X3I6_GEOBA|nr:Cell cycle checkpoint control protein RAD9B [Geodia barretti]